jgi:hypothetical protein
MSSSIDLYSLAAARARAYIAVAIGSFRRSVIAAKSDG